MTSVGMIVYPARHDRARCSDVRAVALMRRCPHTGQPWGVVHTGYVDHYSFDFICKDCGLRWEP